MLVPLFRSALFKIDLQQFARKVQTLDGTKVFTDHDFERISRLGLKVLDEIFNNPKIEGPLFWSQIFTVCESKGPEIGSDLKSEGQRSILVFSQVEFRIQRQASFMLTNISQNFSLRIINLVSILSRPVVASSFA